MYVKKHTESKSKGKAQLWEIIRKMKQKVHIISDESYLNEKKSISSFKKKALNFLVTYKNA